MKSASSTQLHGRSLDVDTVTENLEVHAESGGNSLARIRSRPSEGLNPRARSMGDTFLVCVHNVSEDQPYAILRASVSSTATDIIKQVGF